MKAQRTLDAINQVLEEAQEREHRHHLGASVIGDECSRKLWYGFRWIAKELFSGQMLRLFERGQLEEIRFTQYLRSIGNTVIDLDPNTGKQLRISDCNGHFGGSCDAIIYGNADIPPGHWANGEFKTHKETLFNKLEKEGLCSAHSKHFAQMQTYMFKFGVGWGLYCAVNKNTDDLHFEVVQLNVNFAVSLIEKAQRIIDSPVAPKRIGGKQGASFWLCKMCVHRDVCHNGALPEKNCRTCFFSKPVADGQWFCGKYQCNIPKDRQGAGCETWTINPGIYA